MDERTKLQFLPARDRNALIEKAADELEHSPSPGIGGGEQKETAEGKLIRALAQDEGRFADRPQVIPITDQAYLTAKLPVPVAIEKLLQQYRFYLLQFSFDLKPAPGWSFNSLTVQVEFNPDHQSERPKIYALFPNKKFSQILQLGGKVQAGIGASIDFEAGLAPQQVSGSFGGLELGGGLHNAEGLEFNCLAGPFNIDLKKMLIKTSQAGLEWARWQLDGSQFDQGDNPGLMLVAQVPSDAKSVILRGQFVAKRKFELLDYGVRKAILNIDETFQRLLKGGAPTITDPWTGTSQTGWSWEAAAMPASEFKVEKFNLRISDSQVQIRRNNGAARTEKFCYDERDLDRRTLSMLADMRRNGRLEGSEVNILGEWLYRLLLDTFVRTGITQGDIGCLSFPPCRAGI